MNKTCMYEGCDKSADVRGLCRKHYTNAQMLIYRKRITWEQLEENGKCLPSKSARGVVNNWFLKDLK